MVGKFGLEIPKETLTDSVPGKFYALSIDCSGTTSDDTAVQLAKALTKGLWEKFRAKVAYLAITPNRIDIQLEGSPFAWAALIAFLPSILTLFGIALIGIAVYTVFAAIPSWAWGVLAIGVIFIFAAPVAAKWV